MTARTQRGLLIAIALGLIAIALALILYALEEQITFYKTPNELTEKLIGTTIRIGGFVQPKSVKRKDSQISFVVTDFKQQVRIVYRGVLPDLFREGQGVIAEGVLLNINLLRADKIFAKHDENYKPPALDRLYNDR